MTRIPEKAPRNMAPALDNKDIINSFILKWCTSIKLSHSISQWSFISIRENKLQKVI